MRRNFRFNHRLFHYQNEQLNFMHMHPPPSPHIKWEVKQMNMAIFDYSNIKIATLSTAFADSFFLCQFFTCFFEFPSCFKSNYNNFFSIMLFNGLGGNAQQLFDMKSYLNETIFASFFQSIYFDLSFINKFVKLITIERKSGFSCLHIRVHCDWDW